MTFDPLVFLGENEPLPLPDTSQISEAYEEALSLGRDVSEKAQNRVDQILELQNAPGVQEALNTRSLSEFLNSDAGESLRNLGSGALNDLLSSPGAPELLSKVGGIGPLAGILTGNPPNLTDVAKNAAATALLGPAGPLALSLLEESGLADGLMDPIDDLIGSADPAELAEPIMDSLSESLNLSLGDRAPEPEGEQAVMRFASRGAAMATGVFLTDFGRISGEKEPTTFGPVPFAGLLVTGLPKPLERLAEATTRPDLLSAAESLAPEGASELLDAAEGLGESGNPLAALGSKALDGILPEGLSSALEQGQLAASQAQEMVEGVGGTIRDQALSSAEQVRSALDGQVSQLQQGAENTLTALREPFTSDNWNHQLDLGRILSL